ncbi:AurF N-oxygenase family protein [Streptomyces chartreusis]|uniref:AurF N-oxygenase family protein n=1 Tax=Streptomyces TaxID=1883 RepID=UPI002E818ED5|nr:diiron oxygenase [Streptomyces chartreusis]WSZ71541.1 diiron oxygenase [Streptomyces chartreusis]WUB16136.1 diiron oxygenase [Streptomyces chartreusis]
MSIDSSDERSGDHQGRSGAPPGLPAHDPTHPVESAVISRLSGNWHRRAAVKRQEPDLDDLFEPDRPDCPDSLLPFRDHPTYLALDDGTKARLRAWGWIAFNKNIQDIEQRVVNPGFALMAADAFETGLGESMTVAVTQAMVDEQYHTLMHLNASAVTRRRRGWAMPDRALPLGHKARRHEERLAAAATPALRRLDQLAYTTVAEISINAYLDLVADDDAVQPINRATADLHNRDEYCHSSIAAEIAKAAYAHLTPEHRRFFLASLADGMEAFAANDYTTWHRIVELTGVPGGRRMLQDVAASAARKRLLQDFGGLHRLCREMDVLDELPFDWSTVSVG